MTTEVTTRCDHLNAPAWSMFSDVHRKCTRCGQEQWFCKTCKGKSKDGEWKKVDPAAVKNADSAGGRSSPKFFPAREWLWDGVPEPIPDQTKVIPNDEYYVTPDDWTWHTRHAAKKAYTNALAWLVNQDLPTLAGEGDGIVYAGGDSRGGDYGLMIAMGIRHARMVGYDGPIEWWHDSSRERIRPEYLEGQGDVRVRDFRQLTHLPHTWRGWHAKPIAMANSGFRRVLMLDADAVLVEHPQGLFDLLADRPFVYWSKNDCRMNGSRFSPLLKGKLTWDGVQGGQLLLDRTAASKFTLVALWLNSHADYFDPRSQHKNFNKGQVYGDEDLWTVALEILKAHGQGIKSFDLGHGVVNTHITVEYPLKNQYVIKHYAGNKPHRGDWLPAGDAKKDAESFAIYQSLTGCKRPPWWWQERKDTADRLVFDLVAGSNEYKLPRQFPPGSVVLDLGAHIGCFAWKAFVSGASKIVCVEAHPENVAMLRKNLAPLGDRVEIIHTAVVDDASRQLTVKMSPILGHNTWSKVSDDGAEVPTISFDELLERIGPVELCKFDIEGSELEIIPNSRLLFERCKSIAAEVHEQTDERRDAWIATMRGKCEAGGFEMEAANTATGEALVFANLAT